MFDFKMEAEGVNSMGRAECRAGEQTPSSTSAGTAAAASCTTAAIASAVRFVFITVLDETTIGSYSSSTSHGMGAETAAHLDFCSGS